MHKTARLVDVTWADAQRIHVSWSISTVIAADRKGLLRDISSVSRTPNRRPRGEYQSDRRHERATMRFTAEVGDMNQLSRVIDKPGADPRRAGCTAPAVVNTCLA